MKNKKFQTISINSKNLTNAKNRLSERKLFKVNEFNKNDYYENLINEFTSSKGCILRAMSIKNN